MQKPIYVFDLDGTIFSLKYAVTMLNQELGKHLKIKDLHDYDLAKDFGVSGQTIHDIYTRHQHDLALKSLPNQKLVKDINRWHDHGVQTVALTARPSGKLTPDIYQANLQALQQHNIQIDQLIMKDDNKYDTLFNLGAARFFDDKPSLITKMINKPLHDFCELTLINAPYNQDCPCDSRYYLY